MNTSLARGSKLRMGSQLNEQRAEYVLHENVLSLPKSGEPICLRVTQAVHTDNFSQEGIIKFFSSKYLYTQNSNRMCIRLNGECITFADGCDGNILSEAMLPGDIQVTSAGQPILMMADCQTVGGYTKIAHVITADLPLAAQARPGDNLCFATVTVEDAQHILREKYTELDNCLSAPSSEQHIAVFENSVVYKVKIREIT